MNNFHNRHQCFTYRSLFWEIKRVNILCAPITSQEQNQDNLIYMRAIISMVSNPLGLLSFSFNFRLHVLHD